MPNKFEVWKQGLTLEEFGKEKASCGCCDLCPVYATDVDCGKNEETCYKAIKEWGEQDAEQ